MTTANLRVLFISGPEGETRRYRCSHQQEQLELQGISTDLRTFHDLRLLQDALDYDVFIFHRTPYHRLLEDVLDLARRRGKIALFETDDLIFEPALVQYDSYYRSLAPTVAQEYLRNIYLNLEMLKRCDYALTTTDYLARALQQHKPALINRNAVGTDLLRRSEEAFSTLEPPSDHIVIGYMSGSPTHTQDFQIATDALLHILDQFPQVNLHVVGPLDLDQRFNAFHERIRCMPIMPWQDLPSVIRATHINLAPLELDNPFCQSKSELKYFEAAFLGVPTIASPTEAFQFAIRHGDTGFLARDTQEWISCLELVIRDPARRAAIGEAARQDALRNYTPQVRSQQFAQTLRDLIASHPLPPGIPQTPEQVERRLSELLVDYGDKEQDFTERLRCIALRQRDPARIKKPEASTSLMRPELHVLFISGQDGGTRRYRCFQQQEQLELNGITTGLRTFRDLRLLQDALDYDVFIFHRTPYHRLLEDVLDLARRRGKITLFETDDLIFEPALVQYDSYYRSLAPTVAQEYLRNIYLNLEMLKRCDYALTTTDYLARALQQHRPALINRNAVGVEWLCRAEEMYDTIEPPRDRIVIGYISGSTSHKQDFQIATDALLHILDQYPQVNLHIVGPLELDQRFARFGTQVQQTPFIPWEDIPRAIRAMHINLAPLEVDNPFCQSKSELKYFEAAFLGVPTIASPTEAFQFAIRHGDTGFLARDTQEWISCLELVIRDPARRAAIGEAARQDALRNYTPQVRSQQFAQTLRDLIASHPLPPGIPQTPEQVERRLSELLPRHLDKAENLRLVIGSPITKTGDTAVTLTSSLKNASTPSDPFERSLQRALHAIHRARRCPHAMAVAWAKHLIKKLTRQVYHLTVAGQTYRLLGELISGQVYCQTFQVTSPNLCGVSILFATFGRINTPDVILHLKASPNSPDDLATYDVSASLLRDNSFFDFSFHPLPDSMGKTLCLSIESPQAVLGDSVGLWLSTCAGPITFYKNGQPLAGRLAYTTRYKQV